MTFLYLFAFWSQFQPSEPFLVDYLVDSKGLAADQVYRDVFCLFVYSRLPCMALVGWICACDWVDGHRILVGGALCGIATALLTRFGEGLLFQQVAQLTVAAAFASRVAVPAAVFGIAKPAEQQSSLYRVKAVILLSNFGAAAAGEALRGCLGLPLSALFDISVFGQALSLVFVILLPMPERDAELLDEAPSRKSFDLQVPMQEIDKSCMITQMLAEVVPSLTRRAVVWWTVWALWMNPVHGLAMTYWQGLVRQKQIPSEHNGAALACTYLAAAAATAAAGGCSTLRRSPASLVIVSMVAAGVLLLKVVAESEALPVYACLVLYQCLFEVTTAVATFQVGEEVTSAPRLAGATHSSSTGRGKLTALFSATAVAAGANESLILLVANKWPSIDVRFFGLGICLEVCAVVLLVAREVEAIVSWRAAAGGSAKARGAGASPPATAAAAVLGVV